MREKPSPSRMARCIFCTYCYMFYNDEKGRSEAKCTLDNKSLYLGRERQQDICLFFKLPWVRIGGKT